MNLSPLNRLNVERLTLRLGQSVAYAPPVNCETLIHILIGTVGVSTDHHTYRDLGERDNVFDAPPTCLYLPPGSEFSVFAQSSVADAFIVTANVGPILYQPPAIIRPQDVTTHVIGEGHYQRVVHEVAGGWPARSIFGGETINPPGKWSSWPHHAFDERAEWFAQFEEVFTVFHKPVAPTIRSTESFLRRRGRFCDGTAVDDMLVMRNGESAVVPLGHHPIAAPLDASLLYVWHYLSPLAKQYATRAEDGGYYA